MSQYPTNPSNTPKTPAGSGQLVIIGAGIALVAVILMNLYVEMRVAARDEQMVTFFRFREDLGVGDKIEMSDLETFQVRKSEERSFGTDAVRESTNAPGEPADGLDYNLRVSVVAGQVLNSSQFLGTGGRAGRSTPEEEGERQIAVSIESEEQPSGLTPGDRIDLLGGIMFNGGIQYMPIMEYVEVVSVGDRRSETTEGSRTNSRYGKITINVSIEQSLMLFAIRDRLRDEKFIIALRPPDDRTTPETGGEAVINPAVRQMLNLD